MSDLSTHQVETTLGMLLLGNLGAAVLFGITCVQAYIYFKKSYKDSLAFKLLISFLWFLDNFHLALISHASYHYMVSHFGDVLAIESTAWSINVQGYVTMITVVLIRTIFGRRVWLMSKRNIVLVSCITVTSGLAFVTSFIFATKNLILGTFKRYTSMSYLVYTAFGSGPAADILIAVSLCIAVSRSRTGSKKTESVINTIMMYTINACLLTTISSVACLITYVIWPHALIFLGISYLLSKLYFTSLLATLNSRETLQEKLGVVVLSSLAQSSENRTKTLSGLEFEPVVAAVTQEVDVVDENGRSILNISPT